MTWRIGRVQVLLATALLLWLVLLEACAPETAAPAALHSPTPTAIPIETRSAADAL